MLILISALPLLVILLFIINYILTKYFLEPILQFQNAMLEPDKYQKIQLPKYFNNTVLKNLEEAYNNSIDFHKNNTNNKGGESD
jgi:hypothetical protein